MDLHDLARGGIASHDPVVDATSAAHRAYPVGRAARSAKVAVMAATVSVMKAGGSIIWASRRRLEASPTDNATQPRRLTRVASSRSKSVLGRDR
jgi:hypothetical protein